MALQPSKTQILRLYRDLLKGANTFGYYNFRQYFARKVKDSFRQHAHITDRAEVASFYQEGLEQLTIMRRQALLNAEYKLAKTVIES